MPLYRVPPSAVHSAYRARRGHLSAAGNPFEASSPACSAFSVRTHVEDAPAGPR